jgi:EmrB/QacA subfamily drug resistance transporter
MSRREIAVLLTASFAGLTAILDSSIVNLALPQIGTAFGTSASQLAWVVNAYILPFAVSILVMGRLGDRLGRRGVLAAGTALFAVATLGAALAPTFGVLLAMRAVQGVGASAMLTLSLAVVSAEFPAERRAQALGLYFAAGATAAAVGPIVGGLLTSAFGWPAMFAVQVPLAAGAVAAVLLVLAPAPGGPSRSLDLPGLALGTLVLVGINVALLQGGDWGWTSGPVIGAWVLGMVAAVGFVVRERSTSEPAVPLGVFRNRRFVASSIVGASAWFGIISGTVQLATYLQAGRGLDATGAAIVLAPWPIAALLVFPKSGSVVARYGAERTMLVTLAAAALSALLMPWFDGSTPLPLVSLVAAVGGAAVALTVTASTVCAIAEFPPSEAGIASGIFNSIRQVGSSLGAAIPAAAYDLATGGALVGAAALTGSSWALGARAAVTVLALAAVVVVLPRRPGPVPGRVTVDSR